MKIFRKNLKRRWTFNVHILTPLTLFRQIEDSCSENLFSNSLVTSIYLFWDIKFNASLISSNFLFFFNWGSHRKLMLLKGSVRYVFHLLFKFTKRKPLKMMKNGFYFTYKALFFLKIINFLYLLLPLVSALSAIVGGVSGLNKCYKIDDVMKWLNNKFKIHTDRYLRK